MFGINFLAVVVASVAAFVASMIWYIALARQWRLLSGVNSGVVDETIRRPDPTKTIGEIARNMVLAIVLDYCLAHVGFVGWFGALELGFLLWIGFPVVLLVGSVMRENYPWKLAAIHAGDWLLKLALMSLVISLWP